MIVPQAAPPDSPSVGSVPASAAREIRFDEFLEETARANLEYAAQRYNLPLAQAAVAAAREFKNPTLGLNSGRDVTHSGMERLPDTYGTSLTQTFETGGKRRYRVQGARQSESAAAATVQDFLRNLKFDAAAAFADALASAQSAEDKKQSAAFLSSLVERQRERQRAGDISLADLLQTQLEEQQFRNELLAAQAEATNASMALLGFLGRDAAAAVITPKGSLEQPVRESDPAALIMEALRNRPDLEALRHARDAAQSKIREERANRVPNVDVGLGWTHSLSSQNSIAPAPEFNSVNLGLSLPLPLWNRNQAAIATARYTAEQTQKRLEAAELKVEVQIRQAVSLYRSAVERVRQYHQGILKDADAVLEAKRFSYQNGQTTLLELLDAQRTANAVRAGYNSALADQAKALIEQQRASAQFDLHF